MSKYRKIAEKLQERRVTFASPRPPGPTPENQLREFSKKYLPVRFLILAVILGTITSAATILYLITTFLTSSAWPLAK